MCHSENEHVYCTCLPVCMFDWLRSSGRLCTASNELKLWTPWWSPYMPFWCWQHRTNILQCSTSLNNWEVLMFVCYLWQAGEDGGPAGGAAADRGEGAFEDQAALGQRTHVGSVDHRVVIHLCLKTCIISWRRKNTRMHQVCLHSNQPHHKYTLRMNDLNHVDTQTLHP